MDKEPDKSIIASVNLSRNDILKSGICDTMKSIVKRNGLPPRCIRFEVTESSYMENSERLISTIKEFKEAGFIIEMDDFGSGYSSLNTLNDIDIDVLKLDMRFLSGTENSEKSKIIISAVINMASALGLPVIAEGLKQGSRRTCFCPSAANICKGIISAGRYLPRNMKKCFMTQTG